MRLKTAPFVFVLLFCACASVAQVTEFPLQPAQQLGGVWHINTDSANRAWFAVADSVTIKGRIFSALPADTTLTDMTGGISLDNVVSGFDYRLPYRNSGPNATSVGGFHPQKGNSYFGEMKPTVRGYTIAIFAVTSSGSRYICSQQTDDLGSKHQYTGGVFPHTNGKLGLVSHDNLVSSAQKSTLYQLDPATCGLTVVGEYPEQIGQFWQTFTGEFVAENLHTCSGSRGIAFSCSEIVALKNGVVTKEVSSTPNATAKKQVDNCCEMLWDNASQTALVVITDKGLPKVTVRGKNGEYHDIELPSVPKVSFAQIPHPHVRALGYSGRYALLTYNSIDSYSLAGNGVVAVDTATEAAWTVLTTSEMPLMPLNKYPFEIGKGGIDGEGIIYLNVNTVDKLAHPLRVKAPLLDAVTVKPGERFSFTGRNLDGIVFPTNTPFSCNGNGNDCVAPMTPGTYTIQGKRVTNGWTLASNPVTVTVTAAVEVKRPKFTADGVVNSASYSHSIGPNTICSVFGENFTAETVGNSDSTKLPTALAGTQVLINGEAAPLFFTSPTQINFQMPSNAVAPSVTMQIVSDTFGASEKIAVPIEEVAPALYQADSFLIAQKAGTTELVGRPGNPIVPGSTVVAYGTGFGPTDCNLTTGELAPLDRLCRVLAPVSIKLGSIEGRILFAGLVPGFAGLYQINVEVSGTAPDHMDELYVPVEIRTKDQADSSAQAVIAQ